MVYIPVGLPGSGKTRLGKQMERYNNIEYIDCDYFFKEDWDFGSFINFIHRLKIKKQDYYLDGLFIKDSILSDIIDAVGKNNATICYFIPNIENCLYNDKYRDRKFSSGNTIRNANISFVLNKYSYLPITKITTEKANYTSMVIAEHGFQKTVETDKYILPGSTYGTCWDEDGPTDLDPSDDFHWTDFTSLEKIFQTLDMEYNEKVVNDLFNANIIQEYEDNEPDWYGGCEYFRKYYASTSEVIEFVLKEKYGIDEFHIEYIKNKFPEFLF